LTLVATSTSPTTTELTLILTDLGTDGMSNTVMVNKTISGNDISNINASVLQASGTVGLWYNGSNMVAIFDNFSYVSDDGIVPSVPSLVFVPYTDTNITYSPYNWYNAGSYMQGMPVGAYFKVAFSGTHLGITTTNANNATIDVYLDGAVTPITKSISTTSGEVVISDTLSNGNHYAVIYLKQASGDTRANTASRSLRITGITLSLDGAIQSLTPTPIAPSHNKVIFYGDSITEAHGVNNAAQTSYAERVGRALDVDYANIGYAGEQW
jgi:hypothetical protein